MSVAEDRPAEPKPGRRWFHVTPGRLILVLLVVEALLWLSERFGWLAWHKGYSVLAAVAGVGVFLLVLLLWYLAALVFCLRFQFSIRSLLVLTVAVALPFSWLAVEMRAAKRQREAVQILESTMSWVSVAEQPKPVWLANLLDEHFFNDVESVIGSSYIGDDEMIYVSRFSKLDTLCLGATSVTDNGLKYLKALSYLRSLQLTWNAVSDAGLEHLTGLTQLKSLELQHTQVTDTGVKKLQQALPNCEIIR